MKSELEISDISNQGDKIHVESDFEQIIRKCLSADEKIVKKSYDEFMNGGMVLSVYLQRVREPDVRIKAYRRLLNEYPEINGHLKESDRLHFEWCYMLRSVIGINPSGESLLVTTEEIKTRPEQEIRDEIEHRVQEVRKLHGEYQKGTIGLLNFYDAVTAHFISIDVCSSFLGEYCSCDDFRRLTGVYY